MEKGKVSIVPKGKVRSIQQKKEKRRRINSKNPFILIQKQNQDVYVCVLRASRKLINFLGFQYLALYSS